MLDGCVALPVIQSKNLNISKGVYTGAIPDGGRHTQDLHGLLDRLKEYGGGFSERVQTLVLQLQIHPDLDCRFLGIRLSFSDFYKAKKDQQASQSVKS